ncbi:MAG: hypothetical protein KIS78_29120 [Labilithrix sp.]|nr:hypothetical protein [Labilithrix sp.]MCW5836496.1 hypothetical protein [Labilithrix sp.]
MRRGLFLFLLSAVGLASACESTSKTNPGPQGIHPQPQPNRRPVTFTAPCTATACGEAPEAIASPSCKPLPADCGWTDNSSVSFRQCADSECGVAPTSEVCPSGTLFRGNTCGSENEAPCAWNTACVPPPSTTPCPAPEGCGPKPEIGVICQDGGIGGLECMQFDSRCDWQRTCD